MKKEFLPPVFNGKHLELRIEESGVCIYGTTLGLQKLVKLCEYLINNPNKGHVHLEDYDILTESSLEGVIAIFE